ncbi:response regulator [Rhizobium giardinii]|uniref:response regulator n=1 Tax=Rhizobium giardinii TaxID=56731 RepID=UPI000382CEEA
MMWSKDDNHPLLGTRILIAEDEILIALDMEAAFLDAGADVVGPCATVSAAMDAAGHEELSLAVLDIRLGPETTERVGDLLRERGLPFLFYSGQAMPDEMKRKYNAEVIVSKPATHQDLIRAAASALNCSLGKDKFDAGKRG